VFRGGPFAVALLTVRVLSAQQPIDGMVLENNGKWRDGHAELHTGDRIKPGTPIASADPHPGTIVIWYQTGRLVIPPCQTPCVPKAPSSVRSVTKWLWDVASPLLGEEPHRYAVAVSRGLGHEVQEAVVALNGAQADLTNAFADLPDGVYMTKLEPVGGKQPGSPVAVNWTRRGSALMPAAGLRPGLWEITVVRQGGESGSAAWVLLSMPDTYAARSAQFKEAVAETDDWKDDVDPATIRGLLRACLASIDRQGAPVHKR
jgi:hypothetical protein